MLIDCGPTTLPALHKNKLPGNSISHIVVTHLHGDHIGGIPFLLLNDLYKQKRQRTLSIILPKGGTKVVQNLTSLLYDGLLESIEDLPVEFIEYDKEFSGDDFSMSFYEMKHSETLKASGIRIEIDGVVIAVTGDTEWNENIQGLAANSDLLIGECNLLNPGIPGHMDIKTWEEKIDDISTKRLILTHLGSEMIRHIDQYSDRFEFAYDDMSIQL